MADAIQVTFDVETVKGMVGDNKRIKQYLTTTLDQYANVHNRMHVSLSLAIHHTLVNGDPVHLNRMYAAMRVNDQTAIKRFVSTYCRYEHEIDGEKASALWLSFSTKEGNIFQVRKGTTETRAELAKVQGIEYWLSLPYFANNDVSKPQDFDLLAQIKRDLDAVTKKAKKAEETGEFKVIAEKSLVDDLQAVYEKHRIARIRAQAEDVIANAPTMTEEEAKEVEKTLEPVLASAAA